MAVQRSITNKIERNIQLVFVAYCNITESPMEDLNICFYSVKSELFDNDNNLSELNLC